jgi:hypothetical protein
MRILKVEERKEIEYGLYDYPHAYFYQEFTILDGDEEFIYRNCDYEGSIIYELVYDRERKEIKNIEVLEKINEFVISEYYRKKYPSGRKY